MPEFPDSEAQGRASVMKVGLCAPLYQCLPIVPADAQPCPIWERNASGGRVMVARGLNAG